jgi:hypothetical protein
VSHSAGLAAARDALKNTATRAAHNTHVNLQGDGFYSPVITDRRLPYRPSTEDMTSRGPADRPRTRNATSPE